MSNLATAARRRAAHAESRPLHSAGFRPDPIAELLQVTGRYQSVDRQIAAGTDLFRSGDKGEAIYGLVEGWLFLYNLLEDGRRQIFEFTPPGTVLAFPPTRLGGVGYSAQALTDAHVRVVSHESVGRLFREIPEAGIQIAALIAQDRSLAYERLSSIGRGSAQERVAYLLLELFVRCRMRWPGHHSEEMHLPLTQEHVGDATGLTGVHVNRVLRDLRKQRILEFHYRRLRILDPDRLVEAAGVDIQKRRSWIKDGASDAVPQQRLPSKESEKGRHEAEVQSLRWRGTSC